MKVVRWLWVLMKRGKCRGCEDVRCTRVVIIEFFCLPKAPEPRISMDVIRLETPLTMMRSGAREEDLCGGGCGGSAG
jgi:hypothetical protein